MATCDYVIEPKAPLVFRSGRPFGEGSRDGAHFPLPSSAAGLLRTQLMDHRGWRAPLLSEQRSELLSLPVCGPFLMRRDGNNTDLYLPRPADAVLMLDERERPQYRRLVPAALPEGSGCDLPKGLLPLVLQGGGKGKPQAGPQFWSLKDLIAWGKGGSVAVSSSDQTPWCVESRTHVAVDRATHAAVAGKLFQTDGLSLGPRRIRRGFDLANWVFVARGPASDINDGLVVFGGERRLSALSRSEQPILDCPDPVRAQMKGMRGVAITLATPAVFAEGWRPGWLNADGEGECPGTGVRLRLRAAAVERWQGVSGWDLAASQARATRRAVAAGATYWFDVLDSTNACLAEALWLAPMSDDAQDRRDGFGLAIPRAWTN